MSNVDSSASKPVVRIIEDLVDIGATWARYGLTIGKTALETSAKTLSTSAALLGDLAKEFEHPTRTRSDTTPQS
jgi:hypothetical protein